MDYKLENGSLYEYSSDSWLEITSLNQVSRDGNKEFSISLEHLSKSEEQLRLKMRGSIDNNLLKDADDEIFDLFRSLPPDIPKNLSVLPDEFTPFSIELAWDKCESCDGYYIERSTNATTGFEVVKEYKSDRTSFRDFDLETFEHFYRMTSFNELGISNYSEVVSMIPMPLLSSVIEKPYIYPNPTRDMIQFNELKDEISILSLNGALLMSKKKTKNISLKGLPNSIYIIKTALGNSENTYRVIKQ